MDKKTFEKATLNLKRRLAQQIIEVDESKRNLAELESQFAKAKAQQDLLQVKVNSQPVEEQPQSISGSLSASSFSAVLNRIERKVLQLLPREASTEVDEELEAMKSQLAGVAVTTLQPISEATLVSVSQSSTVDAELEALKRELDGL